MSNYAYSSTPSPRVPEVCNKWTVSPEFSDALLVAMRERSRTAGSGPLPRLPSMLQLSVSPEALIPDPCSATPSKPDTTERLKMKTRVAIRDRNPHRFQVVPLGEVNRFTTKEEASHRGRWTPTGSHARSRSPGLPLLDHKARTDENTAPTSSQSKSNNYLKADTPDRIRTLSERNQNLPASEYTSHTPLDPQQTTSEYQGASGSPTLDVLLDLDTEVQPTSENIKLARRPSSLRLSTTARRSLHIKSPSLGNIGPKPSLEVDLETMPLPRVRCRKRTNTLSADHHFRRSELVATGSKPELEGDRRNLVKKDSVRRHAIYTQSLYVPVHERPSFLGGGPMPCKSSSFEEPSSTAAAPCRSSLPYPRTDDANELLSFLNEDPSSKTQATDRQFLAPALLQSSLPYAQLDDPDIGEDERPKNACAKLEARTGKPLSSSALGAFAFRSSIPSERALISSSGLLGAPTALGFFNMPRGLPADTFDPQSSACDDNDDVALPLTRPLTGCTFDSPSSELVAARSTSCVRLQHHPIVLLLLREVDRAAEEWNTTI